MANLERGVTSLLGNGYGADRGDDWILMSEEENCGPSSRPYRLGHFTSIGNLDEDEVMEVLFNHTEHINGGADENKRLAREICLALAVALAEAYVENRKLELSAFTELDAKRWEEIMD